MKALVQVHTLTLRLPGYERYVLADPMRRASQSIPTEIAKGYGRRKSAKEFKRCLSIALGSANEMTAPLEITRALEYAEAAQCVDLMEDYTSICKMLCRLMENWRTHPPATDLYSPLWASSTPFTPSPSRPA
jgi:four helix bundle protein